MYSLVGVGEVVAVGTGAAAVIREGWAGVGAGLHLATIPVTNEKQRRAQSMTSANRLFRIPDFFSDRFLDLDMRFSFLSG